jgi:hypothetical protein
MLCKALLNYLVRGRTRSMALRDVVGGVLCLYFLVATFAVCLVATMEGC